MKKTVLTKREMIFVCLMLLVLLGLFISSSMTYHEQEMSPGFIHRHFPIIERVVGISIMLDVGTMHFWTMGKRE